METKSTTDVFMSILPEDALEIGRSRKTTISRSYPLPATVRRIWFYTTCMDAEAAYLPASGYRARYTESSPEKVLLGD
ncbi:unnamed protein product [Penicillium camemberti]|uniref:Str. FM013 n=1 Tax=Penicillium camemberti (strain FM 013) TaxID=1429867 RepID=A0A0G4P3D0_PENC3|nr:unnamed protein product [Penicillium camemberti]